MRQALSSVAAYTLGVLATIGATGWASAQTTSLSVSDSQGIVEDFMDDLVEHFTANIDVVLAFAAGFLVLSLLIALVRRFFRL